MLKITHTARLRRAQHVRGIALITSVIMLLVITLLALGGARLALDTKRSTRNQRDLEIAYQAAEAALYDAELDIGEAIKRSSLFLPTSTAGFLDGDCNTGTTMPSAFLGMCNTADRTGEPIWNTIDWTAAIDNKTVEYGTFTGRSFPTGSGLTPARKPRYLIEILQDNENGKSASTPTPQYKYRITAIGFGPSDTTRAIVQSVYRKSES
ncbi:PilX N-terminal domain-containing pilus assembly protein [Cupriavidus pauculus]|uniref:pilus assembly PilX family protein n=1 Tax=Cupriavidus pauculus TaxID=82633 RepID=UPI001EE35968|nr:pilus assembly protein [Cupriavidus pauculus]GJG96624.1 pilus assembly protein PilX [Cupriavidus pauculus]